MPVSVKEKLPAFPLADDSNGGMMYAHPSHHLHHQMSNNNYYGVVEGDENSIYAEMYGKMGGGGVGTYAAAPSPQQYNYISLDADWVSNERPVRYTGDANNPPIVNYPYPGPSMGGGSVGVGGYGGGGGGSQHFTSSISYPPSAATVGSSSYHKNVDGGYNSYGDVIDRRFPTEQQHRYLYRPSVTGQQPYTAASYNTGMPALNTATVAPHYPQHPSYLMPTAAGGGSSTAQQNAAYAAAMNQGGGDYLNHQSIYQPQHATTTHRPSTAATANNNVSSSSGNIVNKKKNDNSSIENVRQYQPKQQQTPSSIQQPMSAVNGGYFGIPTATSPYAVQSQFFGQPTAMSAADAATQKQQTLAYTYLQQQHAYGQPPAPRGNIYQAAANAAAYQPQYFNAAAGSGVVMPAQQQHRRSYIPPSHKGGGLSYTSQTDRATPSSSFFQIPSYHHGIPFAATPPQQQLGGGIPAQFVTNNTGNYLAAMQYPYNISSHSNINNSSSNNNINNNSSSNSNINNYSSSNINQLSSGGGGGKQPNSAASYYPVAAPPLPPRPRYKQNYSYDPLLSQQKAVLTTQKFPVAPFSNDNANRTQLLYSKVAPAENAFVVPPTSGTATSRTQQQRGAPPTHHTEHPLVTNSGGSAGFHMATGDTDDNYKQPQQLQKVQYHHLPPAGNNNSSSNFMYSEFPHKIQRNKQPPQHSDNIDQSTPVSLTATYLAADDAPFTRRGDDSAMTLTNNNINNIDDVDNNNVDTLEEEYATAAATTGGTANSDVGRIDSLHGDDNIPSTPGTASNTTTAAARTTNNINATAPHHPATATQYNNNRQTPPATTNTTATHDNQNTAASQSRQYVVEKQLCISQYDASNNFISTREVAMITINDDPKIYYFENLLTADECQHIINLTHGRLERSKTSKGGISEPQDNYRSDESSTRTSFSARLSPAETAIVAAIENRAAKVANMDVSHLEPLVVVKYRPGQFFSGHHDGQFRPTSVLIYLNDVEAGGETKFPQIGIKILPQRGAAMCWRNCLPSGQVDLRLLHEALPPVSDCKWVVNCFFNCDVVR